MKNYFADNLRYLRTQKGIKQEVLGEKLGGWAKSTISCYENGKRRPNQDDLRKIANFFHVNVDRLLNEDLTVTPDEDSKLYAQFIEAELERMKLSDKEFDMLMNYIDFLKSLRSK